MSTTATPNARGGRTKRPQRTLLSGGSVTAEMVAPSAASVPADPVLVTAALPAPRGVILSDEELEAQIDGLRRRVPIPPPLAPDTDYDWTADTGLASPLTQDDISHMLARLSPRQRSYGAARVHGETRTHACELLRCPLSRARAWEASPWYDPLLIEERRRMFGDTASTFEPLAPLVAKHYERALKGDFGGEVAQSAARDLADRLYGRPTQRIESKIEGGGMDLTALIKDIAAANRALAEEQQAMLAATSEEAEWTSLAPPP